MRTIRAQLVLFVVCLTLGTGVVIAAYGSIEGRKRILGTFEADCRRATAVLASALADPLYQLDVRGLRLKIRDARVNPDVEHVKVWDPAGVLVAYAAGDLSSSAELPPAAPPLAAPALAVVSSRLDGEGLVVSQPVRMPDEEVVGRVEVRFHVGRAYASIRQTIVATVVVTAGSLALGAVLAFVWAGRLARPIGAMAEAARRIGAGDFDARAPVAPSREVGALATSINRMAEDLRRTTVSKTYLDGVLSSMLGSLVVLDAGGAIRTVNSATLTLLGYEESELVGRPFADLLPESEREPPGASAGGCARLLEECGGASRERAYLAKDGARIPVLWAAAAMAGAAGEVASIICTAQSLVERHRVEAALRVEEARFRFMIDRVPAVLWTVDRDLRFTSSMGAGLKKLGLRTGEAVGRSLYEFFRTGDAAFPPIAAHLRCLAGEPVTYESDWEGHIHQAYVQPVCGAAGEIVGVVGMAVDVTEQRRLEEQLRDAQRLEAIGRLAGGVAHDFNNLLTVIQGETFLLLRNDALPPELREPIEEVETASKRAAGLTRQLLAFSRRQTLQRREVDLNAIIAALCTMLRRLIGEDVELATVLDPRLGRILADPGQLEQVVTNLAVNARDAMPSGGRLRITTADLAPDAALRARLPQAAARYALLAVTDTGAGMDADTRARIFEPFFTTKTLGRGTGLGLATVHGIVAQHGGIIDVDSEPGRGTTFRIYLACAAPSVPAEPAPEGALEAAAAGIERVLLVEDEPLVRRIALRCLERSGYAVTEADGPEQALSIVAAPDAPAFDLLLSDVVMPGMNGMELSRRLCAMQPSLRVLFMSGYTDDALGKHGIVDGSVDVLEKPFTPELLAFRVRAALDRPGVAVPLLAREHGTA